MKNLLSLLLASALLVACGRQNSQQETTSAAEYEAFTASVSGAPRVSGNAYAPWARMKADAYRAVHPEDAPSAGTIDIPAYPGSCIVRNGTIGEGTAALDFITLICEDSHEAVIQFYQDRLIDQLGWSYEEQYNVFQPGKGNEFILRNTPFVSVMDLNPDASEMQDVDPGFLKNFRTRIQVTYRSTP